MTAKPSFIRRTVDFIVRCVGFAVILAITVPVILILPLAKVDPPTTSIQAQRRISALMYWRDYEKRQTWMPLESIAPALRRAVVSREDARFFEHFGVDLEQASKAIRDGQNGHRKRGASTITMQLVKNLYLWEGWTLYDKGARKVLEVYLALWMEMLLPKERILEIYLNVIEWGDGIYGAEAAARAWYDCGANRVSAGQAARLAAVLPSPLRRTPGAIPVSPGSTRPEVGSGSSYPAPSLSPAPPLESPSEPAPVPPSSTDSPSY
jgi:monofunctional glycosyltransferase